jgi:DNA-3-methyladenine glycosylase I
VHDDRTHFEFLVLEGAQAGLSWLTILKKREGYRRLFADFDAEKVARFTPKRIEKILLDPGIIRNRAKVEATVRNARAYLAVQEEFGSFDTYMWGFVGGRPKVNRWRRIEQLPATTPISEALSADLRTTGLPLRRADGLLLPPAGGRSGQRPPGQLLPLRRAHDHPGPGHYRLLAGQAPGPAPIVDRRDLDEPGGGVEGTVPGHIPVGGQRDLGIPGLAGPPAGGHDQRPTDAPPAVVRVDGELLQMGRPVQAVDPDEADRRVTGDQNHQGRPQRFDRAGRG